MSIRKILLYVALLAIIIVGAPFVTGYLAEVKFKEVTKVMSELDSVSIEVVKYDRGWWHSFAQTKVSLSPEYAKSIIDSMKELDANQKEILKTEGLSINFNHAIQHGPFIYAKSGDWKGLQLALALFHSEILLLDETKKIIEVTTGLNKLVDIEGKISIEGAFELKFDTVPFKVAGIDNLSFNWLGGNGDWAISRDMKHFTFQFNLPGFSVNMGDTMCMFKESKGEYNEQQSKEGLWLGKINLELGELSIKAPGLSTNNFDLTHLTISSDTHSQSGLVAGTGIVRFEKLMLNEANYGPFEFDSSINRFDGNALKMMMDLSRQSKSAAANVKAEMLQKIIDKLPDILKNRPEVNIDKFYLKTSDGDVTGKLNSAFGNESITNINDTLKIIQSIAFKADLTFPKALLVTFLTKQYSQQTQQPNDSIFTPEQLKQQVDERVKTAIDNALKEGYLIEKDSAFSTEWEFSDSQLRVNGKPIVIPNTAKVNPSQPASALPTMPSNAQ